MKKYNNYKAYYETHKEQEKTRTLAYYKEHREEILAKRKAKRDAEPKVYKPTLREQLKITEKALEMACEKIDVEYMDGIYCTEYANYFKNKAKEELKK